MAGKITGDPVREARGREREVRSPLMNNKKSTPD